MSDQVGSGWPEPIFQMRNRDYVENVGFRGLISPWKGGLSGRSSPAVQCMILDRRDILRAYNTIAQSVLWSGIRVGPDHFLKLYIELSIGSTSFSSPCWWNHIVNNYNDLNLYVTTKTLDKSFLANNGSW